MNPHYLSPTTGPRISLSYTKAMQFSERGDPRNQLARGRCCPGKANAEERSLSNNLGWNRCPSVNEYWPVSGHRTGSKSNFP